MPIQLSEQQLWCVSSIGYVMPAKKKLKVEIELFNYRAINSTKKSMNKSRI